MSQGTRLSVVIAGAALLVACSGGGGSKGAGGAGGGAMGTAGATSTAGSSGSTGTAGAAGTADAGTTLDAGADAAVGAGGQGGAGGFGMSGASRCATSGVLLCESFEAPLDAATWSPLVQGDGMTTLDTTRAFRGAQSLHVKVGTGHKGAINETKTFPIAGNVLYARFFIWFDSFTTTAHFTMAEVPQTAAGAWIRFGGQGGRWGVGTDHGASGDWTQQDTAPIAAKQWTCVEFAFLGDKNEFRVWLDDVERPALHVGADKHAGFVMPPFSSLWFGWQTYSNQAPAEFWMDEIAVDSKPIGCAK